MTRAVRDFVRASFRRRRLQSPTTTSPSLLSPRLQFVWLAVDESELVRRNLDRTRQLLQTAGVSLDDFWQSGGNPAIAVRARVC